MAVVSKGRKHLAACRVIGGGGGLTPAMENVLGRCEIKTLEMPGSVSGLPFLSGRGTNRFACLVTAQGQGPLGSRTRRVDGGSWRQEGSTALVASLESLGIGASE